MKLRRRAEQLARAGMILAEAFLNDRQAGRHTIAADSHRLAKTHIQAAAEISGRTDDAWEQAMSIAQDMAHQVEPMLPVPRAPGRVALRDLENLPEEHFGRPLIRPPDSTAVEINGEEPQSPSNQYLQAIHQAGHAVVAAWITGTSVSVGFAGYQLPSRIEDVALGVISKAGATAAFVLSRSNPLPAALGCECREVAVRAIASALDIEPADLTGDLDTRLNELGRAGDYRETFMTWHGIAGLLTDRAHRLGYLAQIARRLIERGRIELLPAEVPMLAGEESLDPGLPDGSREGAYASVAAGVVEGMHCGLPILFTGAFSSCGYAEPSHKGLAFVSAIAAYFAAAAVTDPTVLTAEGVRPGGRAFTPEDALVALRIVQAEWNRIERLTEEVQTSEWVVEYRGTRVGPGTAGLNGDVSRPMLEMMARLNMRSDP